MTKPSCLKRFLSLSLGSVQCGAACHTKFFFSARFPLQPAHNNQGRLGTVSLYAVTIPDLANKSEVCNQPWALCECVSCPVELKCHSAVCRPRSTDSLSVSGGLRTYLGGDYNVLCYLTVDAEVVLTYHLSLLVCVHIQEPQGVSGADAQ